MIETEDITDKYRLDELVSSFYKIQDITKINYAQYLPPTQNDQWSIHMELFLRKQNPKTLVALLSKELWCFSINDDPLPKLPSKIDLYNQIITSSTTNSTVNNDNTTDNIDFIKPIKYGYFNPDYSKSNLPPSLCTFLKSNTKIYLY